MANPHRGDVSFTAQGKSFTLRWSTNAMCEIEGETGRGVNSVSREMISWAPLRDDQGNVMPETPEQEQARADRVRISLVRLVFWAMLRDQHPDMTIKQAGALMGEVGGLIGCMALIGETFERGAAPETKDPRPPLAQAPPATAGTGSAC